jgi:NTE family protein
MGAESIGLTGRVGLALGSGAARGWAHIGVIRALERAGVRPDVVCGTSMGAMVGAAYASKNFDDFEKWGRGLDWRQLVGYFDFSLRGGLIGARKLFEFVEETLPGSTIESLSMPFAAVGTDLANGQEVWMREGDLLGALRASVAVPGLITPVRWEGRWMVDGGLVNPVPVSLCRALGADSVIAVDLNTTLLGRRLGESGPGDPLTSRGASRAAGASLAADSSLSEGSAPAEGSRRAEGSPLAEGSALAEDSPLAEGSPSAEGRRALRVDARKAGSSETMTEDDEWSVSGLNSKLKEFAGELRDRFVGDPTLDRDAPPTIFDVMANAVNIMQVRIGRSRMAGDPPELLITPRMSDFAMLDFDRAEEAIEEGSRAVARALEASGYRMDRNESGWVSNVEDDK